MASDKQPHGVTLQQGLILAIIDKHGPITSGDVAEYYAELVDAEVAYNYQYIITRRMADRGLIKSASKKNDRGQKVFQWRLTPKGKTLLKNARKLAGALAKIK